MLGRDTLDRERDDLLRLPLRRTARGLANLAHPVGRVGLRLLFHAADQLGLRVPRGEPGELLQPPLLFGVHPAGFLLPLAHLLLAPADFSRLASGLLLPLVDDLEFAVEDRVALLEALLLALDLGPALAHFFVPGFPELHELLLPREHPGLPQSVGLAFGFGDDAPAQLFGGLSGGRLAFMFRGLASSPAHDERDHPGNEAAQHTGRGKGDH